MADCFDQKDLRNSDFSDLQIGDNAVGFPQVYQN
jgi:hypothetical protein